MAIEIVVKDRKMIIHDDVIDRDIALLEKQGDIGAYVNGAYRAPRPNLHGALTCLRDNRRYDASQIESVCMGVCPHNSMRNRFADDSCHLDDCWEHVFNALSIDNKVRYVEYSE